MNSGKWFVRGGSLAIILGFFMPTMIVSCAGLTQVNQTFSLYTLADQAHQSILFLLLLGAAVAAGATLLRAASVSTGRQYLLVQIGAMAIGVLAAAFALLSLSNQIQQGTSGLFQVTPDFGAFVIVAGLAAIVIGTVQQWQALPSSARAAESPRAIPEYQPPPIPAPSEGEPTCDVPISVTEPDIAPFENVRLVVLEGTLQGRQVEVDCDSFTIGRSSENNLVIRDPQVSRFHAKLRFAGGAWFIQDAGSSGGTFVNGEQVPAQRLNSGDIILIGNERIAFYG